MLLFQTTTPITRIEAFEQRPEAQGASDRISVSTGYVVGVIERVIGSLTSWRVVSHWLCRIGVDGEQVDCDFII